MSGDASSFRQLVSSVLRSKGVEFEDASLFLLVYSFANKDGSNCFPSHHMLADMSGHSIKWVKRGLARLEAGRWLTWQPVFRRGAKVNLYSFHWGQIGPDRVRTPTPKDYHKSKDAKSDDHQAQNGLEDQAQNGPATYSIDLSDDEQPLDERREG